MDFFVNKRGVIATFIFIVLSASSLYGLTGNKELNQAFGRLRSGDYLLAEKLFTQLQGSVVPQDEQRRVKLGLSIALLKNGHSQRAIKNFLEIEGLYPDSQEAREGLYWRGVAQFSLQEYSLSQKIFQIFLKKEIKEKKRVSLLGLDLMQESMIYLAWSEYHQGKMDETLSLLDQYYDKGYSLDYQYSIFSLTVVLYLKDNRGAQLYEMMQNLEMLSFSKVEKVQAKIYFAQTLALKEGMEAALEDFISFYRMDDKERLSKENRISLIDEKLYALKRVFNYYEKVGSLDLLAKVGLEAIALAGIDHSDVRRLLLRAASVSLKAGRNDLVKQLTADLVLFKPFDCEAWSYRIQAIKNEMGRLDDVEAVFPVGFLEAIDGHQVEGDFCLLFAARESILLKNWKKGMAFAQKMMKVYPNSQRKNQALYLAIFAAFNRYENQVGLDLLEKNSIVYENRAEEIRFKKLEASLYRRLKRYEPSLVCFKELIKLDSSPTLLIQASLTAFEAKKYDVLDRFTSQLLKKRDLIEVNRLLAYYFHGLAAIGKKDYRKASEDLQKVSSESLKQNKLSSVIPWLYYYRGWASYRLGNYEDAINHFSSLIEEFGSHPLRVKGYRLSGWAALSARDYVKAVSSFKSCLDLIDITHRDEIRFLYGRSLAFAGEQKKAVKVLVALSKEVSSEYADDALFEVALSYQRLEDFSSASQYFKRTAENFKHSDLTEEALFSSADSLFYGGDFQAAADGFSNYRRDYPEGYNYQLALFRGANCWKYLGDSSGALFLYQRLYDRFPNSPYAGESLIYMAQMAADEKKWSKASAYYHELQQKFPSDAKAIKASSRLKQLSFRAEGKESLEAELLATFEKEKGVSRSKGRKSALELAQLYLNLYRNEKNIKQALAWLDEVISKGDVDPNAAAEAWMLKGREFFRRADNRGAISAFIEAAAISKEGDIAASSLYQAIGVALEAGAQKDALVIFGKLKKGYPKSEWIKKLEKQPLFKKQGGKNE